MIDCECILCGNNKYKNVYLESNIRVVKCIKCGLIFQCPKIINDTNDYYIEREDVVVNPNIFRKRRIHFIIKRLKSLNGKAERILDVGCGWGYFLKLLHVRYKNVAGVEPNKQQSDYLLANNYDVYQNIYTKKLFDECSFDIVSFIQVLEHIPDPFKAVKASYKHLKKNGILVIDVPSYNNPRFLIFRITRCKYVVRKDFIIPHLYYFTPKTLKMICEQAGFEIIHSDIGQYSVKWGVEDTVLGNIFDHVSNFLNIGSITIYAKKK
ncbi:MAG: class I SAM-dependent methyltransferase [Balneolales bacterium]